MLTSPSRQMHEHVRLNLALAYRLMLTFTEVELIASVAMRPAVRANSRERFPRRVRTNLHPAPLRAAATSHRRGQAHVSHVSSAAHPARASRRRGGRAEVRSAGTPVSSERTTREQHGSSQPARRRGESHVAYLRRVARWKRTQRPQNQIETAAVSKSNLQIRAVSANAVAPGEDQHLVPPSAVARGPQISAAGPVAPVAMEAGATTKVTPAAPAGEMAEAAVQPKVLPLYNRNGRLVVPAPLRGSREVLVHQNQMADAAGLERVQDDGQLDQLRSSRRLVMMASTESLHVNPELPEGRRCARPWTAHFAADIARAYYARFGQPLELNSAVRTISYQLRLQRVNGNAAAIGGETASPHLTGQAIDFGKRGMTMAEIAWMRAYLLPLMQSGAIDVEEEFQQSCFHISVYRSYGGGATGVDLAQVAHGAGGR